MRENALSFKRRLPPAMMDGMTEIRKQPRTLTVHELYSSVRRLAPRTAVFDFDGTLWPGDAGTGYMHWTIQQGVLAAAAAERILARHAAYHRGEVGEIPICGEMVQIYAGLPEATLRGSAQLYFQQHVRPAFFPEMIALLKTLQSEGTEVWAVSSTNNWMIEEGVRELGIPAGRVLAACVAVEEGIASANLIDVPSDEGKAEALRRAGLPQPDAVFGNSVHDAAMLAMARGAFPINPSAELEELSADRGWPVYYPAARSHGA